MATIYELRSFAKEILHPLPLTERSKGEDADRWRIERHHHYHHS